MEWGKHKVTHMQTIGMAKPLKSRPIVIINHDVDHYQLCPMLLYMYRAYIYIQHRPYRAPTIYD